jgi:hypothetical protein
LDSVEILGNVTKIGNGVFNGCVSLSKFETPSSVLSIGDYAFNGCVSLKDLVIGENVESIGNQAFYGCTSLQYAQVPDKVKSVGTQAFDKCTDLRAISLGKSVQTIGYQLVSDSTHIIECKATTPPQVEADSRNGSGINSPQNTILYVPNDSYRSVSPWSNYDEYPYHHIITVEFDSAKVDFTTDGLKYAVLANGTCKVVGCDTGKQIVTIPETTSFDGKNYQVTELGSFAFVNRTDIKSLTIPHSIKVIHGEAIWYCTLDTLTLAVTLSKNWNVSRQNRIAQLNLAGEIDSINNCGFMLDAISKVNIGYNSKPLRFTWTPFEYCTIDSLFVDRDFSGDWAFMMEGNPLSTIKDLTFGKNVTSIGDGAFSQCCLLKDLTIPRNIENVGQHAFDYCTGLRNVTIEKITAVKQQSEFDYEYSSPGWDIQIFFGCGTFSVLHFCEDVKIIPSDLCGGVQTIYSDSKTPPLFNLGYFDVPKTATVYVPADAVLAYKEADVWKEFWNIVGVGEESALESIEEFDGDNFVITGRILSIKSACKILKPNGSVVYSSNTPGQVALKEGIYVAIVNGKAHKFTIK